MTSEVSIQLAFLIGIITGGVIAIVSMLITQFVMHWIINQ